MVSSSFARFGMTLASLATLAQATPQGHPHHSWGPWSPPLHPASTTSSSAAEASATGNYTVPKTNNLATATYSLEDDYSVANFFGMFSFFTGNDPTNGFVDYVDQSTAQSGGLIQTNSDSVYIGVDHTNVAPNGRQSVRLGSTKTYTHGLFILDLAHMPGGICGTWPAFWTVGPDWPGNGEIDIIEQVNDASTDQTTLHASPGCTMSGGSQSGTVVGTDCDATANGNAGCGMTSSSTQSYGAGFNADNGGVYAMEWTSSGIAVWSFPRSSVPSDALGNNPNPSGWGTPLANFQGPCNIDSNFNNHQIVFDNTFCGDWAGNVWAGSSCAASTGAATCNDYVANNPSAFTDSYWQINSLRVYSAS